ncbi:negative cofactor 2 transcription regulator complex subunit ncb2 [Nowakowskiella sp. JEL0407]|nr:negative cofactor 2 transcription regulator complex subunit ncb2 [Nowakowskiella sp. JEL0407]
MDDDFGGSADKEFSLPKATVQKLIQEMLPDDIVCSKEARDLLSECCVEFVHLISTQANEISEKESKSTITGDHVLAALKSLDFDDYVDEVNEVFKEHVTERGKRIGNKRAKNAPKTEEELLAIQAAQDALLLQSRERFQQSGLQSPSVPTPDSFLPSHAPVMSG